MSQKVTVLLMRDYLERFGWNRYEVVDEPLEEEGLLRTGWRSNPIDDGYVLVIDPMVEKSCLSFRVPEVLSVPLENTPTRILCDLMVAIGFVNYMSILGKFAYDPRDGEIRFSLDVPTDENDFTYAQFAHCLRVVITSVERFAPLFDQIRTGELTLESFMRKATQEPAREALRALRDLIEELERLTDDEPPRER